MVTNLRTSGAESLAELAAKLKRLERGDLKRELARNMRAAGKPLVEAARRSARENLPKQGGLNEVVAASKISVRTRTPGRNVGVRMVGTNAHHVRSIDEGRVRHPVYGNRDKWVTQQVTPGWWTKPMEEGSPRGREAIIVTIRDISRRL